MADALKWFNVFLAALGSLAALGALNKMHWRETRPCIAGAMLLIAAGLGAQWLGEIRGDWVRVADTATFGGILVLIIASQKVPSWFLERWANPAASIIAMLVGIVFICAILAVPAQAADARPEPDYTLSPAAAEACDREGGCMVVTRAFLYELVRVAQAAVAQTQNAEAALAEAQRHCPRPQARRELGMKGGL